MVHTKTTDTYVRYLSKNKDELESKYRELTHSYPPAYAIMQQYDGLYTFIIPATIHEKLLALAANLKDTAQALADTHTRLAIAADQLISTLISLSENPGATITITVTADPGNSVPNYTALLYDHAPFVDGLIDLLEEFKTDLQN